MSPTPATDFIVDHAITQDRAPGRELEYVPEPVMTPAGDPVQHALGIAVIALANVDRALRNKPPVSSTAELHPHTIATFLRAARETALAQHPRVVLEAVDVASTELRESISSLLAENDPDLMRDACQAMARLVIEKYRKSVYDAFADVRAEQSDACSR